VKSGVTPVTTSTVSTAGRPGRMWAREHFDLPAPPDVVTWAKKAQNGVLFVSEDLATFFQEEKKFNTTWEGDAVGMVRLLATIDRLHLEDVERTGARVRAGLERLTGDFPELLGNVRGLAIMLGVDVARADWRDVLRDRAFRRGLLLMGAVERALRVCARYDTEPYAIDEAMAILRAAVEDVVAGDTVAALGPRVRVGRLPVGRHGGGDRALRRRRAVPGRRPQSPLPPRCGQAAACPISSYRRVHAEDAGTDRLVPWMMHRASRAPNRR